MSEKLTIGFFIIISFPGMQAGMQAHPTFECGGFNSKTMVTHQGRVFKESSMSSSHSYICEIIIVGTKSETPGPPSGKCIHLNVRAPIILFSACVHRGYNYVNMLLLGHDLQ